MDKKHHGCDEAAFAAMADENAADLLAVYEFIKGLSTIDGSKVIAAGNSAGGFGALALGAHATSGLKAVINFSGGWHSLFVAGSCAKSGLVPEFHNLGAGAHVPTLWFYAQNDGLFPPKSVALMHDAFTIAGGLAEMPTIGKSGDDGHYLFSESEETREPLVESFLQRHGLLWEDLSPKEGRDSRG
jgi:dienelactone hydrolase